MDDWYVIESTDADNERFVYWSTGFWTRFPVEAVKYPTSLDARHAGHMQFGTSLSWWVVALRMAIASPKTVP